MKGISTIIASIIMVVITIGLISVAYLYMSGLLTGRTATNIQLSDAYCTTGPLTLYMIVKNLGTSTISSNLTFVLKGTTVTSSISCDMPMSANSYVLTAGNTTMCRGSPSNLATGSNELRIIGPSNAVGGPVPC